MAEIVLKTGRQKSVLRRHPWVFSGAISSVRGKAEFGDTVAVVDAGGRFLARGAYSPESQIRTRIWTFSDSNVDADFFSKLLERAIVSREPFRRNGIDAFRLVNGESDGFPGLIVDVYGGYVVCQFLAAGVIRHADTIVAILAEKVPGCRGIFERSDVSARKKEGVPLRTGVLWGEPPPAVVEISEGPWRFLVDIKTGQKTGFYLDQRRNRLVVKELARGLDVLNVFSYTGAFAVAAKTGGASRVTCIDSSGPALDVAKCNLDLNGFADESCQFVCADAFVQLRRYVREGIHADMIILDPPKFVDSQSSLKRACRAYKDVNLQAFLMLKPGGLLVTFSCSGLLPSDLFDKVVADAALDAKRQARILHRLTQADDHATSLSFPEGSYLKGLVCAVS